MGTTRLLVCFLAGSLAFASGSIIYDTPIQKPFVAQAIPSQLNDLLPPGDAATALAEYKISQRQVPDPNLITNGSRLPSFVSIGASVVPGIIPVGTTLYHGWSDGELPSTPEWLAFDPEHSVVYTRGPNGHLFTFVTIRPLRILYFDGSSAAKITSGATDTQNFLAWGHTGNQSFPEELDLVVDLCNWGKPFGIDGYVRMELNFEVIYCDFHQGIEVVSSLHVLPAEAGRTPGGPPGTGTGSTTPPGEPSSPDRHPSRPGSAVPATPTTPRPSHPRFPKEPRPPHWKGALTPIKQRSREAFQAGAWHRRAPGEVRVHLDVARLVSLYDPALRSGALARKGLEKILHRGKGLSQENIDTFRAWVINSITPGASTTSGIDWQALTTVIMDRYSSRLEYLQLLLNPDSLVNATAIVQDVRAQLMIMLMPDITPDTVPSNTTSTASSTAAEYSQANEWVKPILDHCSSYLVSHLPQDTFTREERTLYAGISGTLHEICRVLSLLWSEAYDPLPTIAPIDLVNRWKGQVHELMKWLDWTMWNKCTPECGLDSMCFIPTWPMGIGSDPAGIPGDGEEDLTKVDWTPRCVSKEDERW